MDKYFPSEALTISIKELSCFQKYFQEVLYQLRQGAQKFETFLK